MINATGFYWAGARGLEFTDGADIPTKPDIVFYFVDKKVHSKIDAHSILRDRFPDSVLFGCSTSGPVLGDDIYTDTFTGLAVSFEKTKIRTAQISCHSQHESYDAGKKLVEQLLGDDLAHVFVITDGMSVHGTNFLNGANEMLPDGVGITGGMASDGFEFKETLCGIDRPIETGQICAIGLYGHSLRVGCAAEGGWDTFGLERVVTRSDGNILYELDGKPALDLYKEYLGEDADKLPGAGLLFPLSIRKDRNSGYIVRTIDIVDEEAKSLRFTGDIPQGYIAQFMKGNFGNLVVGAGLAAEKAKGQNNQVAGFALVVSCLGRQLLMGSQISDELQAVCDKLGSHIPVTGFYSNGEYSYKEAYTCVLHNQTMTMTLLQET